MSIVKHINKIKNAFNNIEKVNSSPQFYIAKTSDKGFIVDAFIDLNAPFKMIKITHVGYLNVLEAQYNGFSISSSSGKTYIMNYNKILLDNNYLLSFKGRAESIRMVEVFGFGQGSTLANMSEYKNNIKESVSTNDDIVSSTGLIVSKKTEYNDSFDASLFVSKEDSIKVGGVGNPDPRKVRLW